MAEIVPVVDAFDSGCERFAEAIGSVEPWNGVKSGPLSFHLIFIRSSESRKEKISDCLGSFGFLRLSNAKSKFE